MKPGNPSQTELFNTEVVEYIPRIRKPIAEITQDDIVDKLFDIHDMALSDDKPNYQAALKAVEIVAKMKGMLDISKINLNIQQETYEDLLKKARSK